MTQYLGVFSSWLFVLPMSRFSRMREGSGLEGLVVPKIGGGFSKDSSYQVALLMCRGQDSNKEAEFPILHGQLVSASAREVRIVGFSWWEQR